MWQIPHWQTFTQGGMNNMKDLDKIFLEVMIKTVKFFGKIIAIAFVLFGMAMIFFINYNLYFLKRKQRVCIINFLLLRHFFFF